MEKKDILKIGIVMILLIFVIIVFNAIDKYEENIINAVVVNEKAKDMGTYSAQNLRAVYYWAKINGYDSIWQPKKVKEVQ